MHTSKDIIGLAKLAGSFVDHNQARAYRQDKCELMISMLLK